MGGVTVRGNVVIATTCSLYECSNGLAISYSCFKVGVSLVSVQMATYEVEQLPVGLTP